MSTPRQLGVVRSMDDLQKILRARAEELAHPRCELDRVTGLPDGWCSKLLAPRPVKRIGAKSLPLLLEALRIELVAVESAAEPLPIVAGMRRRRHNKGAASAAVRYELSRRFMREIGRKGGIASRANSKFRKERARKAAKARWSAQKAFDAMR